MLSQNGHTRRIRFGLAPARSQAVCLRPATPQRLATAAVALTIGLLGFAQSSTAADLPGSFNGNAFATMANVIAGPVATSLGRSAFQPCPCEGTNGQTLSNTVTTLRAGDNGQVLTADVTLSTAMTTKTAATAEVKDTASITKLNVLAGLITADAITAVADVAATSATMDASSAGSTFANLRVAGIPINANVAPNTVIALPGIGTVTLNKVHRSGNFTSVGQILVEMISVNVSTANSFGLPVGATITVAHAIAGFRRTQPTAVLGGQAYVALANDAIGSDLQNRIGKAALVVIGCQGTGGKTLTNSVDTLGVAGLVSVGTGTTSAFGGPQNGVEVASTTATVESVQLLGGLIGASTITAAAQATFNHGTVTTATTGSSFIGLTVLGLPIPLNVPPNTGIDLPGIGRIVINEQIPIDGDSVQVNGLHIFVTTLNLLGLPVGAQIVIAHADAHAAAF